MDVEGKGEAGGRRRGQSRQDLGSYMKELDFHLSAKRKAFKQIRILETHLSNTG